MQLYTCHLRFFSAPSFNPGVGPGGRFHWFPDPPATRISVMYAGETQDCALFETVFHNVPVRARATGFKMLLGKHLYERDVTELAVTASSGLSLVQLHDPGLSALGLRPGQLTDTTSFHYPRTTRWAQACHEQLDWAQGLIWMSARLNTNWAVILFGDRIAPGDLAASGPPFALDDEAGFAYVRDLGGSARIDVTRPSWL